MVLFKQFLNIALSSALILSASGCGEDRTRPGALIERPEEGYYWTVTLAKARADVKANPDKSEYRAALLSAIQEAEDYYLKAGRDYLETGDVNAAEGTFSRGLLAVSESQMLRDALENIKKTRESLALTEKGRSSLKLGRTERAISQLEEALQIDPGDIAKSW